METVCLLGLFVIAAMGGLEQSCAASASINLAPHRAVYNFTLDQKYAGARFSELAGRYVYELTGNRCAGYHMRIRFVTRRVSVAGEVTLSDLRMQTWENGIGTDLRFNTEFYSNQRLTIEGEGQAKRTGVAAPTNVSMVKPNKRKIRLTRGVLFPVQHSLKLLAAAEEGQRIFTSDLYDVAERDTKVYRTTAILGKKREPGANASLERALNDDVLDKVAAWPVAISYFDPDAPIGDAVPKYESSFWFFENGISRRIVFDYGAYAIRGRLMRLEMLKEQSCERQPATEGNSN
ncbi:MAG: EipB family protein [Hyphomicrobiaceae bacterium]